MMGILFGRQRKEIFCSPLFFDIIFSLVRFLYFIFLVKSECQAIWRYICYTWNPMDNTKDYTQEIELKVGEVDENDSEVEKTTVLKPVDKDKPKRKRWSLEEDINLLNAVLKYGDNDWESIKVAANLTHRTTGQVSQRWNNRKRKFKNDKESEPSIIEVMKQIKITHPEFFEAPEKKKGGGKKSRKNEENKHPDINPIPVNVPIIQLPAPEKKKPGRKRLSEAAEGGAKKAKKATPKKRDAFDPNVPPPGIAPFNPAVAMEIYDPSSGTTMMQEPMLNTNNQN